MNIYVLVLVCTQAVSSWELGDHFHIQVARSTAVAAALETESNPPSPSLRSCVSHSSIIEQTYASISAAVVFDNLPALLHLTQLFTSTYRTPCSTRHTHWPCGLFILASTTSVMADHGTQNTPRAKRTGYEKQPTRQTNCMPCQVLQERTRKKQRKIHRNRSNVQNHEYIYCMVVYLCLLYIDNRRKDYLLL